MSKAKGSSKTKRRPKSPKATGALISEAANPDNKLSRANLLQAEQIGTDLISVYCDTHAISSERACSHTISDAITNILHFAHSMGFNVPEVTKQAVDNYLVERGLPPLEDDANG